MQFAPKPVNEESRLNSLRRYEILDTHPEPDFDDFVALASLICCTPLALISLIDVDRQWSKARLGLVPTEISRNISFCAHAILQADVFVVFDAAQDKRFHDNPMVIREPFVRFYAGAPLETPDGSRIGTLCVMDYSPRQLNQEQIRALQSLSRQVINRLELGIKSESMRRASAQQVAREQELQNALSKVENAARTMDMALEGASVGVWDWDLTTDRVDFDRRWCEMLGLSQEHTVMELKTWEALVHPDDLAQAYQDIHAYMKGETSCYENIHRLRHANGEWIYILDRGRFSEWDQNGKPIRFTGTHMDITAHEKRKIELQEAQRQLEDAEITGRFGSWRLNLITGESHWSHGHNLIFDLGPDDSVPSFEAFLSSLDPEERVRIKALYHDLALGRISQFETDFRVLTKSGKIRYVKNHGQVQCDANQRPQWLLGTVQDITSLKLMEKSLIESREEAISATKTKSRFLASMSHEIRTPLNGIVGNTILLMDTSLAPEQREMLETIKSSSEDLLRLIDDILDFSKIEAGKLDIELHPFDIRAAVDDAVKAVSRRAAEKGITLEVWVEDSVSDIIISDHFRFRQILQNLLSNAVKFTDRGKVRVDLSHIPRSDSRIDILVSVEDSGIGISAEQQEKLFKDFTQVDGSTTRKYGGTGLGLAICKQLCTLLGGRIEVQSELGKGSRFSFRIAAMLGKELTPINVRQAPTADTQASLTLPSLKVLVAEDNEVNQAIALQFLKKFNLTADLVDNGQAAVDAVKREFYDVVFMDVHMPIMDGYDATRKIRAECPADRQPFVVALTADAMKEDKNLCLDAGMNDFLRKPLNLTELANSISKLLTMRTAAAQDAQPAVFRMDFHPAHGEKRL
jgi:PAS domain S-box-containing protein